MDSVLKQLADRLEMLLMQEVGFAVDTARFCAEHDYAEQVLVLAREVSTPELSQTIRQIKSRQLELLSLRTVEQSTAPQAEPPRAIDDTSHASKADPRS